MKKIGYQNVLDTNAVLATIDIEFHVKYDLPEYFLCFSFNFFMLESEGSQKKREVLHKYVNIRKEKVTESYAGIFFAASYKKY